MTCKSTWDQELPTQAQTQYQHAKLVLFRDAAQSACGVGEAAIGPFYAPGTTRSTSTWGSTRSWPPASARRVTLPRPMCWPMRSGTTCSSCSASSGRFESRSSAIRAGQRPLGADGAPGRLLRRGVGLLCRQAAGKLETGDVEEGLGRRAAVGDDRIQKMTTGRVSPENFTHGTRGAAGQLVPARPAKRPARRLRHVCGPLARASSCHQEAIRTYLARAGSLPDSGWIAPRAPGKWSPRRAHPTSDFDLRGTGRGIVGRSRHSGSIQRLAASRAPALRPAPLPQTRHRASGSPCPEGDRPCCR